MILLSANNASTTLGAPLTSGATSISLATGAGTLFPSPGPNEYFTLTLCDALTQLVYEVCWCTARTGDNLTVLRAQEGTSARSWLIGDYAYNTLTAASQAASQSYYSTNEPVLPYTVPVEQRGITQVASGSGTITLPPTASIQDGFLCPLAAVGGATITVNPNSAAVALPSGSTTSSFAVTGGLTLQWSALADSWLAVASPPAPSLTYFVPVLSSTSVTAPFGYTRMEAILQGGGGGGCNAQGANVSGGGGGAGGLLHAIYNVGVGSSYQFTVGSAGAAQTNGGNTTLSLVAGSVLMGTAGGGSASQFTSATFSPGGQGGVATPAAGVNYVVAAVVGGWGSDGQGGTRFGFGNGAPSTMGGGGRAGSTTGEPATGYGAGGGGAYNQTSSDTSTYPGAAGSPGVALYRWLP